MSRLLSRLRAQHAPERLPRFSSIPFYTRDDRVQAGRAPVLFPQHPAGAAFPSQPCAGEEERSALPAGPRSPWEPRNPSPRVTVQQLGWAGFGKVEFTQAVVYPGGGHAAALVKVVLDGGEGVTGIRVGHDGSGTPDPRQMT